MGKLLKYEMRSMWRKLLPLYAAVLLLATLGAITLGDMMFMIRTESALFNILQGVGTFAYVTLLIAMYVVTLMLVLQRFYHGVLGDEGYLTHMLPLSTRTIVWSKLWSGTIAFAATTVVTFLSIAILLCSELAQMLFEIPWADAWEQMMAVAPDAPLLVIELAIVSIISLICSVALLYLCMALGHLSNKHRILMSFVAYFGISMASNTLSNIVLQIMERMGMLDWVGQLLSESTSRTMMNIAHAVTLGSGALTLVLFGASMAGTIYIVKRKLNLE